MVAVPKLQFLEQQPWIYEKKLALDRFFGSLFQNQPGFGTGSMIKSNFIFHA
jgi:hypothetical protein